MTTATAAKPADDALSKRAKRKQPNNKNLWVANAPRIQSMDARAANYLRVAGLHPNQTSTTVIDKTKNITIDPNSPIQKFGRLLGGTDQRVRHQAVLQLRAYLKQRCGGTEETDGDNVEAPGLSQMELLRLWKCLWFTLYMADQVPVQEELANHLSKLIWCVAGTEEEDEFAAQIYFEMCLQQEAMEEELDAEEDDDDDEFDEENEEEDDDVSDEEVVMHEVVNTLDDEASDDDKEEHSAGSSDEEGEDETDDDYLSDTDMAEVPHRRGAHLASLFLRCLLMTVQREWCNMDKYRIDKFYTLLRLVLRQVFEYMAKRHWNLGIIRLFNDVLIEEVLSQTPNGMRLHFMDVCVDELAAANATAPMPLTEATLIDVLEPYFAMAQSGADGDDSLHQRAVEKVLLKFLDKYSFVAEEQGDDVPIFDQVHVGTVAEFIFELASDGTTRDKYRKALYDVHKQYMRRLKQVGRDVELQQADDSEDDDDAAEQENHELEEAEHQEEEESSRSKSHKKKKRKKDKGSNVYAAPSEEPAASGKKSKSAKAAKKESIDVPVEAEPVEEEKKSKKKKKKRSSAGNDELIADDADEEITISVKDQEVAKKAMSTETKKKNKKQSQDSHDNKATSDSEGTGKRRVKFGELNRARSWTASMRGLRTKEPQAHKVATPEKGILLNKDTPIPIVKGKRKKATDYF